MKNSKTTVIYHSADFDGIFCREIAREFLGTEGVEYIGWDFGNPPLAIPSEGQVIIMDLPVDRVFYNAATLAIDNGDLCFLFNPPAVVRLPLNRLVWIDHHKSSIETHPEGIPGYRIDGVAACRLAWQWFTRMGDVDGVLSFPEKKHFVDRIVPEPLAVRLAGEYDIWDKRDPDAEVFQFGLRSGEVSENLWALLLSPQMGEEDGGEACGKIAVDALLDNGRLLQRYQQGIDADMMNGRSFLVEFEGLKFLALNTARCNSLTFAARDVPATGHDALMGFYYDGKQTKISLYHSRDNMGIDLSAIAVKYGGGGHRGACGFVCGEKANAIFKDGRLTVVNRTDM